MVAPIFAPFGSTIQHCGRFTEVGLQDQLPVNFRAAL